MPKLPILSGRDVVKTLSKIGYEIDHHTGSHIILRHEKPPHRRITVPDHKDSKGNIKSNNKASRLDDRRICSAFVNLLKG